VDYAPMPSDIFWENLSIPRPCWYLNAVLINCALGLILFFLTTPAVSQFLSARVHYTMKIIQRKKKEKDAFKHIYSKETDTYGI